MSEVVDVVYVLYTYVDTLLASAFSRTPNAFISRVSLNRALSVFFSQPVHPVRPQQRFGICEPRETTCASSSSSATSAGRVPHPWSLRAPRGTRELEFHDAPRPLASRGPRVPALRRGAFPDPRRTRRARSRRMRTPKRRARFSFTPKPDLERSIAHTLFLPPPDRDRPRGLRAPARARHETPAPVPPGVHPRGERARQGR